jgi:hypothetical protein
MTIQRVGIIAKTGLVAASEHVTRLGASAAPFHAKNCRSMST